MSGRTTKTNVLPSGSNTIPLPSEECEDTFHVTSQTEVPLLDETTAKRREVLNRVGAHGASIKEPIAVELPKGETIIRLGSDECENKFHLSSGSTNNNGMPLLKS